MCNGTVVSDLAFSLFLLMKVPTSTPHPRLKEFGRNNYLMTHFLLFLVSATCTECMTSLYETIYEWLHAYAYFFFIIMRTIINNNERHFMCCINLLLNKTVLMTLPDSALKESYFGSGRESSI